MITVEDQYKHAYQDELQAQLVDLTRVTDAWERKAEHHLDANAPAWRRLTDIRLKRLTAMWKLDYLRISAGPGLEGGADGIKVALTALEKAIEDLPPL